MDKKYYKKNVKLLRFIDKASIIILSTLLIMIINKFAYNYQILGFFYFPKKVGFFYWIGWGYFLITSLFIKYIYEVKLNFSNFENCDFFIKRYRIYRNTSLLFAFLLIISIVN